MRAGARPLHLGIVGFGRVVRDYYVPALRRHGGMIASVAVADPLAASRAAARKRFPGAAAHADHGTLLASRPDALLVASPPSTHLRIWNDAAEAGIPVFMEKPFVLAGELDRARQSPDARRLLMVNFNRRFWPTYRALRVRLQDDDPGSIEANLTLHVDLDSWCRVTAHRRDPAEGGVLHDLGSQLLDLAGWLLPGVPASISAESPSTRQPADHVRLHLRYPSGATATCDVRYGARTREWASVRTSRGTLRLDDPNMALHVERSGASRPRPLDRGRDVLWLGYRAARRGRSMSRATIAEALGAFLATAHTGGVSWPNFRIAARNVAWLEAAARALTSGRAVELPPEDPD